MTEPKRSLPARVFRFLFKWLFYFVIVSILLVALYAVVSVPTTLTMLFDSHGAKRDWTSLSQISPNLVRAVIAAEDAKFCTHDGFDRDAIEKGTGYARYARKVPEFWFTFLIENIWGKRRIMEVYLNVAETGIGTYGAEEGARRYFKKRAANLSRVEAARLAAALPLPKKREVNGAGGFTRRYGNSIAARIRVVQRDGLDACIYK
jgi:monofunctional biosynthetic peptidoglycan transglycosylase